MRLRLKAGYAATFLYVLLLTACGDVFRPVAIPIGRAGGDPATQHSALVVNNAAGAVGSVQQIDVSGDTVMSVHDAGHGPIHASMDQQPADPIL